MSSFGFPTFTKVYHNSVYPAIDPTSQTLSAKGKIVFVTGGGRGIGKAIALVFATAGARAVVILGRNASSLESAAKEISAVGSSLGHNVVARFFAADMVDTTAVANAVKTVREELGAIDVFISNAASLYTSTTKDFVLDDYWGSVEINTKGTLNCIKAFLDFGIDKNAAQPPTFINITSAVSHAPPLPNLSSYAVAKIATWKMMQYLSAEMGDQMRVFTVHPGMIGTDMSRQLDAPALDDEKLPGAFCLWLVATPAADFLGGRFVWSNWDVEELLQRKEEIVENNLLTMVLAGWSS